MILTEVLNRLTSFWLWRADHGRGAGWTSNPNKHGLIVNGNNVPLGGLFVEHTQEYQAVWNGNGGRVCFYQSETPCDPPRQQAWKHGEVNGYACCKVPTPSPCALVRRAHSFREV